jgi:quercetin dioxygenase-like cupin family protein
MMRVVHGPEVEPQEVTEEGAERVTVRWLLARPEGAPSFAMRLFEVAPGGHTPRHEHAWEHEVFMLEGEVEVIAGEEATALTPGDAALVLPHERHQFRNKGGATARFLCLIPFPE